MDYLVEHAIRNVWCNPEQDRQYRYLPHRISPPLGDYILTTILGDRHNLPNSKDRFYVYQIGAIPPSVLGLRDTDGRFSNDWIHLPDVINANNVWVEMYLDHGRQIPKVDIYYKYGVYQNLIIAVRENKSLGIDYSTLRPYVRVYSNAFFGSARSLPTDRLECSSMVASQENIILTMQIAISQLRQLNRGNVFCYVNGYLVDEINILTAKIGDSIEYLYDSSVKRIVTFTVSQLNYFLSELDSKRKYLLSYDTNDVNTIEYFDDTEVYIVDDSKGALLHRHLQSTMRMVTHRDYSVSVDRVEYVIDNLSTLRVNPKLRLYIRHSGYDRPLVFENSRIHELYKLPFMQRYRAMLGLDASLPQWNAIGLENGAYVALMRSPDTALQRSIVEDAYGYNACSVIIGNTPQKTHLDSGRQQVKLPIGLWSHSTAFEYDSSGLLLGYYYHTDGTLYNSQNANCRLVEMISGMGSHSPTVMFGSDNIQLPIGDSYRVYYSHQYNGLYLEDWVDITDTNYYRVEGNILKWNNLDDNQLIMVRTDSGFLAYDLYITPTDGIINFTLSEIEVRNGASAHYTLPVPMGELDIWINGNSAIEGLDYHVSFPDITICSKDYLLLDSNNDPNTLEQKITIRFTGFCNSDLSRTTYENYGFVSHGVLSRNNRFDIRDDRVLRIIYDGRTITRDEVLFAEGNSGISIVDSRNGRPYAIRDIVVPMKNKTDENTYVYREKSRVIDKAVSDYLSLYLPEPPRDAPSAIAHRYALYSPFITKILYDLISGHLDNTLIDPLPDRVGIQSICKPYESWLVFDPIRSNVDKDYVVIHPHNHRNTVNVNYLQYRFLKAVVDLYAPGLIELSPFVAIESLKEI